MNLAQPAAVIHIKTDTFHSLLEVFDLGVGVVEGRQFAGQALEDKVDNDEGDDLVGNIDDDLIQEGAQQVERPAAWVAANTISPQTLPVVPPQKMTLSGVEISTATKPATQAVMSAWGRTS